MRVILVGLAWLAHQLSAKYTSLFSQMESPRGVLTEFYTVDLYIANSIAVVTKLNQDVGDVDEDNCCSNSTANI